MTYPLVQLVSAPALDAEVRFDFNDERTWPDGEAFSLGVTALLGDVGSVNPDYSIKTLSFPLVLQGDEALALRKLGELARELQRDETYLFFQLTDTAPPMWLHCYRSSPGDLSFATWFRDRDVHDWRLNVSLAADPFAMGEQESRTVTISNDPAAGGLAVVLDDIKGDAPTPLSVDIAAGETTWAQPWLSVMPLDGSWSGGAVYWQAESWAAGSGMTTQSDPFWSGGSAANLALTATDTGVARRLTGNVTVPFAGRWRLFARINVVAAARGFPTDEIDAVVTVIGAGDASTDPVRSVLGRGAVIGVGTRMVDLGIYTFPKGNMPSSRPYALATAEVGIDAGGHVTNPAAVGSVQFDYVVAIPLDLPLDQRGMGRVCEFTSLTQTSGDKVLRLDAEREAVQEIASGAFGVAAPETPTGGFLQVVPGASNVLTVLPRRGSDDKPGQAVDSLTQATTLTLTYSPRWLYLASS